MTTPQAIPRPRIRVAGRVSSEPGKYFLLDQLADVGHVPVGAYSLRKLKSDYSGYAVRVVRPSDNAEQDIGFSGRNFDISAYETFVDGETGEVKTWYDQSGHGNNLVEDSASQRPRIVIVDNEPFVYFLGNQYLIMPTPVATPPFEFISVSESTSTYGAIVSNIRLSEYKYFHILWTQSSEIRALTRAGGDTYESSVSCTPTARHIAGGHWEAVNYRVAAFNDTYGTPNTTSVSPASISHILVGLTRKIDSRAYSNCRWFELLIFDAVLSETDRALCRKNQARYYGITL